MTDETPVTAGTEVPPAPRPGKRPSGTGTSGTTDTPPRRTRAKAAPKGSEEPSQEAPPRTPSGRTAPLQRKLEELFAAPALLYSLTGDEYGAHIVATRTPAVAEAWYELSKENPAVRRVLTRLVEGSAWGGVAMSSLAVALPLLAHHGLLPDVDPFVGIYPPFEGDSGSPIVPPPPMAESPRPPGGPQRPAGGGTPSDMTPPLSPTEPPGVVTVAGTNNNARG